MGKRAALVYYFILVLCILILVCAGYGLTDATGELNSADTESGSAVGDSYTKLRFVILIDIPKVNITKIRVEIPKGISVVSDEIVNASASPENRITLVTDKEKQYVNFNILPESITQKSIVKFGFYVSCLRVDVDTPLKFKIALVADNGEEFVVRNGNVDGKVNNNSLTLTVLPSEKPIEPNHQGTPQRNLLFLFLRDLKVKFLSLPEVIRVIFVIFVVLCLAFCIGTLRGLKPIYRSRSGIPIIYKSFSLMPPMRSATKKKISGVTLPSFRQEWSLLLNTLSPYVIWVIDAKSQTYVMEYAHKGDLAHALGWLQPPPRPIVPNILNTSKGIPKLITEHKFRPGTDDDLIVCLTIVLQVAKGLRELRDQADLKVYFDVKLSNILIWKYKYREDIPEVRVHMKLTDLGTAAGPLAVGGGGSSFFRCRECLNTRHPISEKCDVFALGRLLWFLIMYVRGEYKLTIDDGAKPPPPGDTDVTKLTPEELKEILYKTIPGDRYEALREVYDETQDYKIEYEDFIGKLIRIRRPLTANLRIHEPIKSSLWQHLWHDTLKTIHGWPRKIISAMSLFFILACFTGFTPPVIEINGTVKDAMAKTPISGAKLTIDNEEVATTEEDGSYFTAVPLNHRKHEIQAYHENYKEQSRPLDITVKRSVANFILPLKNISIDPVIIKVIEKEVVIRTPEIPNVPPESPRKPAPFWYFASMYKVTVSYDNVKPFTGDYRNGYWIYKIPREQTGVLIDGEQSLSRWGPGTVEDMPEEEAVKAAVNEPVFIANTDIYELSEEELYQRSMKEEESAKKDSSGKHLLKAIRYLEAAVEKAPGNIKFLKSLRTQYGMARKDNKAEEISRRIKSLESGD